MAEENRVVLVVEGGSLSAALVRLQALDADRMNVSPLIDRDYDLRGSDYEDMFSHDGYSDRDFLTDGGGSSLTELLQKKEEREREKEEGIVDVWVSDYLSDDDYDRMAIERMREEMHSLGENILPSHSSCRGLGPRKGYHVSHAFEDDRFGRRRWTDSKDHKRRKLRSRLYRKARLMESSSLVDHDAVDLLEAFLEESEEMEEVVALRAMGFHDLAARL